MASLLTEIPDVLDMRELWLSNMLLLGFDPIACEEKYKLPFTRCVSLGSSVTANKLILL